MKTLHQIKLQKARIDTERITNGLEPIYGTTEKELNAQQAKIHNAHEAKRKPRSQRKPLYPSPCCGVETEWVSRASEKPEEMQDIRECSQCGHQSTF